MILSESQTLSSNSPSRQRPLRHRAQLSCDQCRKYKRKCSRNSPCTECQFRGKSCSFQRATITSKALIDSQKQRRASRKGHSIDNVPFSSNSTGARAEDDDANSMPIDPMLDIPAEPELVQPSSNSLVYSPALIPSSTPLDLTNALSRLETLLCTPNTLQHIISVWRSQDDWYHEIVDQSPFSSAIHRSGSLSVQLLRRYAGLIYAIVAIVAESTPSELDAVLIQLESRGSSSSNSSSSPPCSSFTSAVEVGQAAIQAAKAWLKEATADPDATRWNVDVFQTSFLLTKYNKFCGNWTEYRDGLALDIGRLQRAKWNVMSHASTGATTTSNLETCARYRTFWHYFTLERMSSLFDGVPYSMQARNCDIWLYEDDGKGATHIQTLCNGTLGEKEDASHPRDPHSPNKALLASLSPCTLLMIQLAALAGKSQDRIMSIQASSHNQSQRDFLELPERVAAKAEEELLLLHNRLHSSSQLLSPSQRFFITIAMSRVRRDVAVQLSESIQSLRPKHNLPYQSMTQLFTQRRLEMARALIQCAATNAGRISLRTMSEPFFTMFVHDPVVELTKAVERQYKERGRGGGGGDDDGTLLDNLRSAFIGRNLLVVISRQSELPLNHRVVKDICMLLARVLKEVIGGVNEKDMWLELSDPTRIVSADRINFIKQAPPAQDASPASSLPLIKQSPAMTTTTTTTTTTDSSGTDNLQQAEDVLDWIASLPALQQIFELTSTAKTGGGGCGPDCDGMSCTLDALSSSSV